MKPLFFIALSMALVGATLPAWALPADSLPYFAASNPLLRYTGRIDFSRPQAPRFWSPGVYVEAVFTGGDCEVIINDEELYGKHNYLEIVVDGQARRLQTTAKHNTIPVASGLGDGPHTPLVCKNTESNIGFIEFAGIRCRGLLALPAAPLRRMEFIGNSITCGTGSDLSVIACGMGKWEDQHNAWMSYGPQTARMLNAQWQLTAVSGIGLMHSCCQLDIVMPQVFDKVQLRTDSMAWDFGRYQPDVVTVCLGQNDGVQDSAVFCGRYTAFLAALRKVYPRAALICLSSPMADAGLTAVLQRYLGSIVASVNTGGDKNVHRFFFSKRYHNGCDGHPDLAEHGEIARELGAFVRKVMNW